MKTNIRNVLKWAMVLTVVFVASLLLTSGVHAQDCDGGTRCDDYDELMQYLQSDERRNPEYRIIQVRDDQPILKPRHKQYRAACYFFAIAPILDYLGYTQPVPYSHYSYRTYYAASDGLHPHSFDAGYYLSAEHLMGMSIRDDTLENMCERDGGWVCNPFVCLPDETCSLDLFYADGAKTTLNTAGRSCANRFEPGEEYGVCSRLTNTYEQWLDAVGSGCGGRCDCRRDASCGMYWFANQVLNRYAGCNDMRKFEPRPNSGSEILHMRRTVKEFIDHNLPLSVAVRDGGHFMILIGYLDLAADGWPTKAILMDSDAERYLIVSLTSGWSQPNGRSLLLLLPWNHHVDGACESDGWAVQLDDIAESEGLRDRFRLCSMPGGWTAQCAGDRVYGAQIVCEDNGLLKRTYFAYDDDLFIIDDDNVDCDKMILQYSDGQRGIRSATIQRYWYSPTEDRWRTARNHLFRPDFIRTETAGHRLPGPVNVVEWDSVWPDDRWLIADGLDGTYSKRRATIEMVFDDGTVEKIELSPPATYGITLDCIDNGRMVSSYTYEADHGVFRSADARFSDKYFFAEERDRSCDDVQVRVNLGQGETVVGATLQRMYYSSANGEWRQAQSQWHSDSNVIVADGLTGYSREFTWDDVWRNNSWLVADDVGSGSTYGDRKTILRLYNGSMDLLREIEIVPH